MEIKNEEQQIRERFYLVEGLIRFQQIKIKIARSRYNIKRDWILSFWIFEDTSTLQFCVEREEGIESILKDYNNILESRLNKLILH